MEKQRFMARLSCCHSNGYSPVECQAMCNLARFVGGHVEEASVAASHDVRWLSLWHSGTVAAWQAPGASSVLLAVLNEMAKEKAKHKPFDCERCHNCHMHKPHLTGRGDLGFINVAENSNKPKQSTFCYLKSYKIPRCPKAPKALKLLGPWSLPPEDCVRCQDWISDRFVSGQICKDVSLFVSLI